MPTICIWGVRATRKVSWNGLSLGAAAWAVALTVSACGTPDDVLFTAPDLPLVDSGGVFRATFNRGPDIVRGFNPLDGRLIYRSHGLDTTDAEWRLLSISPDGGPVREEVTLYRTAVLDSAAQVRFDPGGRTFATWRVARPGAAGCGGRPPPIDIHAPPGPTAVMITLLRLDHEDGRALSSIPTRAVPTPTVFRGGTQDQTIRILPAELEIRSFIVDPYGPAVAMDGSGIGYLSDGEVVWRLDLDDASVPAESIVPGTFPALSADGELLAVAQAIGLDSVVDTVIVPSAGGFPTFCLQETITISPSGWRALVYRLVDRSVVLATDGLEPQFDPLAPRIVVRREDALYWVGLDSGTEERIADTDGGYAPSVSPDGALLAFTSHRFGSRDVFLKRIERN